MTGSFEAQLVKKVVNDIIKTLDRVPLQVAKYPVGLETVKKDIIQKLHLGSAQTVVRFGIWGIGGIGKTTVAKAVYNEACNDFDAASFVFNVRSTSLTKLQGQILKDLVNYEEELYSVEKGKYLLTDRLRGIRALVILDDVDDRVQLEALAGHWLSPGSCLIITSRDRHILNAAHISSACIHEMSGLEESEGLQLFSWHAFLRPSPITGYEVLSKRIVQACKGHPLSLEIIGAFLYDKQNDTDIDCWNEILDNFTVNKDIFKTLKISYKDLSAEERDIFLDIACFFIGERTTNPILFWKSMYKNVHIAITNLSMKLLIKIDEKDVFDMHDLVREMGRMVAEEEQTRQWRTAQSSSSSKNVSNISGLRLYKGDLRSLKMLGTPRLRYLHLEQMHIEDSLDNLPPSLRWLKVDSCSFPKTMYSSILFKDLILTMKKKFASVVDSIPQLRIMDLTDCRSLQNLPDNIGHLSHLQSLNLSGCLKLDCLPNTISNLSQLLYLNLSYCERLVYLPDSIGNLSQLQYLNLTCCRILIELPDSIGKLSQLKQLSLSWCEKLESLPESISNLSKLGKPKLCLLGLPPRVMEWRRGEQRERSLTENQDQTEEWTTPKFRESMTEFRATLAPECQNLESKLTKITNQPKRRPELKLPGKATKGSKHKILKI
ncbi:hypothetical protein SUGI_0427220 [Cryptomeria japonica]|nr:hypothetical protein SUGI_0427220 [Cryptomeria japonica]